MSSYKKIIVFLFLSCCLISCSSNNLNLKSQEKKKFKEVKIRNFDLEDLYIVYALESQNQRKYEQAKQYYKKLFENTDNFEYLNKFVELCVAIGDNKSVSKAVDDKTLKLLENTSYEEDILRNYIISLISQKKHNEALEIAKKLLSVRKSAPNYKLLGKIYFDKKEYKKAYKELNTSLRLEKDSSTLFLMAQIKYFNLDKKQEAITLLEDYLEKNEDTYNLSLQLLGMYEMQKEDEKALNLLKKIYKKYENNKILNIKLKELMVRHLVKKDIKEAINFAESNLESNPDLLLVLYQIVKRENKYIELLKEVFKKTNNYNYLGDIAIYEFEKAKDKKAVLDSVIKKFKKVVENISNHKYENYLAYLLIDYDKDINYGLTLVNKALKVQPNNLAYIDTLAWGEYKVGNCKKAYDLMKKVIDELGLKDEEVKIHWEKIKECKE